MNYSVEYHTNHITISDFRGKYQNQEKFMAFCRECPRYNSTWSCPPLFFDVDKYLDKFTYIYVICAKIKLSSHTIAEADTSGKIKDMGWEIVSSVKTDLDEKLLDMEKHIPDSVALSSGGCIFCEACSRKEGLPCRQPDKMRYSMDAFGFDLTAITKDMFSIDIQWCKDRLPDYFTLIHGLLSKTTIPEKLWKK
ncbi:DUF2284 domain-containing protein [Anaerovibrio sp. RM50]|uniref:DUF2284 domain-containing protein n=1 Tax=Anaerovibrio sp. RM50 TaxID=1200557 RepID=UPI000489D524|nr:DUF2284 domain-containing protein [Anaerovibrio sp. RM50]